MPRVSVIIPAYNAAEHLPATLASVRSQTYGDWEIVLADDGSTDETAAIARGFGDRLRLVRSAGNKGPGRARNLAARQATGELLATLDADDLWEPEHLARKVEVFDACAARGERAGLVACDARLLGPDGLDELTYADYVPLPERVRVDDLLRTNCVFNSVLVPAEVFAAAGGYDGTLRSSEDHDLWLRIAEQGHPIVTVPEPLAVYRLRPGSASDSDETLARTSRLVYERALARGRLTAAQRRVARRSARLHRAVELRAAARAARERGEPVLGRRLRALPLAVRVALEHPERWRSWVGGAPGSARATARSAALGR